MTTVMTAETTSASISMTTFSALSSSSSPSLSSSTRSSPDFTSHTLIKELDDAMKYPATAVSNGSSGLGSSPVDPGPCAANGFLQASESRLLETLDELTSLKHESFPERDISTGEANNVCFECKNQETVAVVRCLKCIQFLCSGCVMRHQFVLCSSEAVTFSANYNMDNAGTDTASNLVQRGRTKMQEIWHGMNSLEHSSRKLDSQMAMVKTEVTEAFAQCHAAIEERKAELLREMDSAHSKKQMVISSGSRKAQEAIDNLNQMTTFLEQLLVHARNGEVALCQKTLERKFSSLLSFTFNAETTFMIENPERAFNFSTGSPECLNARLKTVLGHLRVGNSNASFETAEKQVSPISRPHQCSFDGGVRNAPQTLLSNMSDLSRANLGNHNHFSNGLAQGIANFSGFPQDERQQLHFHRSPYAADVGLDNASKFGGLLSKSFDMFGSNGCGPPSLDRSLINRSIHGGSFDNWTNASPSDLNASSFSPMANNPSCLGSNGLVVAARPAQSESLLDLAAKMQHFQNGHSPNGAADNIFPPKLQVKRQKMIYHCKFGEFGIMEGQFTEPSGVAVNAQNDIIVADTNNHRIQIFDKDGRFKFQFGECGKKDGQLLYPNRVAVVKQSGDIVVTERSPTHQVQIFNHYGQFVRKFGANILQHPRGVCVDNKGRIIVVECKVMRIIIFDQMGNVLNKFGCSKHLEFPNGVVTNDKQEIFISDNRAHCVKVFNYEGAYLRQIGGEGLTNYPIGVGINSAGELTIADNHNNFNLTVFSQDGRLLSALESKVKHAQCFDVALMDDGSVVLASKDYRLYLYRYVQALPII